MDTVKELPIFCDNCPTLAFASLNDALLCETCLLEALKRDEVLNIKPLKFRKPAMFVTGTTHCLESAS